MKKITAGLLVIALVMTLLIATSASGGGAADPVVTKSYVETVFTNEVITALNPKMDTGIATFKNKIFTNVDNLLGVNALSDLFAKAAASNVRDSMYANNKYIYSSPAKTHVEVKASEKFTGDMGTMFVITSGKAKCISGTLINITNGREMSAGNDLGQFTTFMFPESGGKVEIISATANVMFDGKYVISGGYDIKYAKEAYAMKDLGLVRGATSGMELARSSNRAECITMLVRLLGEENAALAKDHAHHFTDVESWAKRYVGYAYQRGYTKGVSSTKFGGSQFATAAQYITFILRSLGYSENAGDFKFATAVNDAVRLGVIPQNFANELKSVEFKRDHMMRASYLALFAKLKGQNTTLLSKLVSAGVVKSDAANKFMQSK